MESTEADEENTSEAGESADADEAGDGQIENADSDTSESITGIIADNADSDAALQARIDEIFDGMTDEEKVAQLFIISPEQLTGVDTVTAAGSTTRSSLEKYPVGGIIYFAQNLTGTEQTETMLARTEEFSEEITGLPIFLCIDEEGGKVARIADNSAYGIKDVGNMADIGETGDAENAREVGKTIGEYLSRLGFNVDFAPVADVLTNSENTVVKDRSFGSDAELVAEMVAAEIEGFESEGMMSCAKHFPGHGGTTADTHEGYAYINDDLEELYAEDLVPFISAIEADVPFIMVGHISVPNVIGDDTPASMSSVIMTDLLREELGYEGIIVTDAMNMGAITESYGSGNAAVTSFLAGADMILYPASFSSAYNAMIEAVESGDISEERLDESVERIIRTKLEWLE